MIKRIGIMGAGAIGSVVGGMLTRAGHDVTLIDQWPAHVSAMQTTGLQLSGTCGEHLVPVKAVHLCDAQAIGEPFDAMFLSVKGYDTDWATLFAIRFLSQPDGVIVDFQNGMNDERVAALAGRERTLGCVDHHRRRAATKPRTRCGPIPAPSASKLASSTAATRRGRASWSRSSTTLAEPR